MGHIVCYNKCAKGERNTPRRQYVKVGFVMNAQMNIGTVSDMDMKMNFTNYYNSINRKQMFNKRIAHCNNLGLYKQIDQNVKYNEYVRYNSFGCAYCVHPLK
jgi:hypothetical protein